MTGHLDLVAVADGYGPVLVLVLVLVGTAAAILVLAHTLGPSRRGADKDATYECGMPLIVGARRRLNVRFYLVAVLFLLFDVEVIFLWPWATAFHRAATNPAAVELPATKEFLLIGMGIFLMLLLVGYVYEWRKGAFQWD